MNNESIIEVAQHGNLEISGTLLVNNGEINGTGTIILIEEVIPNIGSYDDGIEYVIVDGEGTPSNYSRLKFVSDPDSTVKAEIYESKISGSGSIDNRLNVEEIKIIEAE